MRGIRPCPFQERPEQVPGQSARLKAETFMVDDANLASIRERAIDVLGSEEAADDWLDKRSATLGGTPRELSRTGDGRDQVLLHLNGISRHRFG